MGMESFPINVGQLTNMSLSKTKVDAWARSTNKTEWLILVQLVCEHGCEQKIIFFPPST
jgi:hypothetical protein